MRVINYNLWHGLSGRGIWRMLELEPPGQGARRFEAQIHLIRRENPDLVFLQEVNPLAERARRLARELSMEFVTQPDQFGLKVKGWGPPWNLLTGLLILARPELLLRHLKGVHLSGRRGWYHPWMAFQLTEFRFALLAEVALAGRRVLLINVHLHHGPPLTGMIKKELVEWVGTGRIKRRQAQRFAAQVDKGHRRRQQEVERLLKIINASRAEFDEVVLAGDFNAVPEAMEIASIREFGLHDCAQGSELLTWNPPRNAEFFRFSNQVQPPVAHFRNPFLLELLRRVDAQPRRIDYVFLTAGLKKSDIKLLGTGPEAASDHFGLVVDLV